MSPELSSIISTTVVTFASVMGAVWKRRHDKMLQKTHNKIESCDLEMRRRLDTQDKRMVELIMILDKQKESDGQN
jgi:hypothetical protein